MIRVAIRMLLGDKAKYIGVLIGITFTSLLLTQQPAIFLGLMTRTYSFIDDTPTPDLWVMDPEVQQHADNKPMLDTALRYTASCSAVRSAMAGPAASTLVAATHAKASPNTSVRLCPASARRASEPARNPKIASITTNPTLRPIPTANALEKLEGA